MEFIIIVIAVVGFLVWRISNKNSTDSLLKRTAERFNLRYNKSYFFTRESASGKISEHGIFIETHENNNETFFKIKVKLKVSKAKSFRITEEGFISLSKLLGVRDLQTGDRAFDPDFILEYTEKAFLFAILNSDIRKQIRHLRNSANEMEIKSREMTFSFNPDRIGDASQLRNIIEDIIAVSNEITSDESIVSRLIKNIKNDPEKNIRINNLKVLTDKYLEKPKTKELLIDLLNGDDLDLKILSASFMGKKGMDVLHESFNLILKMDNILKYEMYIKDIISVFNEKKSKKTHKAVKNLMRMNLNTELIKLCCSYCESSTSKDFISPLIEVYKGDNHKVQEYVLNALKACGDLNVIESLIEEKNDTLNPLRRKNIQDTIDAIQAHHATGEKGWVSLEESTCNSDGSLSLSSDGEGRVSVTQEKRKKNF